MRLKDKVALITGGGTGMGRATAELFAREGAKVAVSGRRKEKLEETVAAITSQGGEALAIPGDVSRHEDARQMVMETIARWGQLDILINNAGAIDRTKVADSTEEDWDRIMAINVKAIFLTSKYAIPQMIRQGGGCIINVSSISALRGQTDAHSYSAAKAAVCNLTKAMAVDYAPYNIRVNAVLPGLVETEISRTRLKPGQTWQEMAEKHWIPLYPLKRLGTPEDIAKGILYLVSDDASWVTGIDLIIDGGYTARL
jgi:NAD(P)-dependent dehydrogenase (short-subunit alcohol dehydrogenase family)